MDCQKCFLLVVSSFYIWLKNNMVFQKEKPIIQTVKYSGNIWVWGCIAAAGPGGLAVMERVKNSVLQQKIINENFWPFVKSYIQAFWSMQQIRDPKQTT